MRYPLIAAQLFNTPLMALPASAHTFADTFIAILSGSAPVESRLVSSTDSNAPEVEAYTSRHASARYKDKPYAVTENGVGILPIHGAMVQRMGQLTPDCMEMTSYEKLSRRFDAMLADQDVRAILFELDTPGGQVAGNFEFARRIMAARDKKKIWAHANEHAYSAGYSIAASAERMFMADTGGVANVGVLMLHMNMTARDAKLGYEYTAFYSGARKNDFNPHFKLSSEAKAAAQDTVNRLHNTFAGFVALARGLTVEAVNATESAGLDAASALAGKFVDGVASFSETLAMLEAEIDAGSFFIPGSRMAAAGHSAVQPVKENHIMSGTIAAKEFTQADLDTAVAKAVATLKLEHDQALAAAKAEGAAAGRQAERDRIKAINDLPEAAKRPSATKQIVTGTEMDAPAAKLFLAGLPEEGSRGGFSSAMAGVKNPAIGAGGDAGEGEDKVVVINAEDIFARRSAAASKTN